LTNDLPLMRYRYDLSATAGFQDRQDRQDR
jgi:hypothetical protein